MWKLFQPKRVLILRQNFISFCFDVSFYDELFILFGWQSMGHESSVAGPSSVPGLQSSGPGPRPSAGDHPGQARGRQSQAKNDDFA